EEQQGDGDVEQPLRRELRLVRWRCREREEWDAFELLHFDSRQAILEKVHRHASADSQLFAEQEDLLHLIELLARDGEDDLVDELRKFALLEQRTNLGNRPVDAIPRPTVGETMT